MVCDVNDSIGHSWYGLTLNYPAHQPACELSQRRALRGHPHVTVMLQHPPRHVPGYGHERRVRRAGLRELGDRLVPEVLKV